MFLGYSDDTNTGSSHASEDDSIIPDGYPLPDDGQKYFLINIVTQISIVREDEDGLPLEGTAETNEYRRLRTLPFSDLVSSNDNAVSSSADSAVAEILTSMHVPLDEQPCITWKITECALSMSRKSHYAGSRVLPMSVSAQIMMLDEDRTMEEDRGDEDDDLAVASRESMEAAGGLRRKQVPASRDAVEALETVTVLEGGGQQCVVCQEELVAGTSTAKRMPCGHVYHGGCIAKWLIEVRNFCPLCRFQLPV